MKLFPPYKLLLSHSSRINSNSLFQISNKKIDFRKPSLIRLGKLNLLTNEDNLEAQDFDVDSTIVHEQYTRRTKINDIALIKLKRSIVSTVYVHPACLYTKNDDPIGLIVTGWGSTSARQCNINYIYLIN